MSRFIPVVILSAVLLTGCAGLGSFGILPKSSLPIIGGGENWIGNNKTVYMKNGDKACGVTYYDTVEEIYLVTGNLYRKEENEWINIQRLRIPASQVLYITTVENSGGPIATKRPVFDSLPLNSRTLSEKNTSSESYNARVVIIKTEVVKTTLDTAKKIGIPETSGIFRLLDTDYKSILERLATLDRNLKVFSIPGIKTLENEACTISISNSISDGIELQVIPKVKENNLIAISIKGIVGGREEQAQEIEMIVKEGEQIILSGLKFIVRETPGKIPIFGDIPLVGMLFRTVEKSKRSGIFIISIIPSTNLTSQK